MAWRGTVEWLTRTWTVETALHDAVSASLEGALVSVIEQRLTLQTSVAALVAQAIEAAASGILMAHIGQAGALGTHGIRRHIGRVF